MPDRQMNRAKDRQREWQTDGRMERRADRQMDGETNEQTAEVYKNIVAFDTPPPLPLIFFPVSRGCMLTRPNTRPIISLLRVDRGSNASGRGQNVGKIGR